jgi:hypothetical protein
LSLAPAGLHRRSGRPEIASAISVLASPVLGFLDEGAIEALLGLALEHAQAGHGLVEVVPLFLKFPDALGDSLEPATVLRRPGRVVQPTVRLY